MSRITPERIRLGPLERDVMNHLWTTSPGGDVASVHGAVGAARRLARNTIQSTLERLVRKGLVARRREGRAYHYVAILSRPDWIAEVLDVLAAQVGAGDPQAVLSGFVDFAERTGDETLAALEAMVGERRRSDGRSEDEA